MGCFVLVFLYCSIFESCYTTQQKQNQQTKLLERVLAIPLQNNFCTFFEPLLLFLPFFCFTASSVALMVAATFSCVLDFVEQHSG
jgi:hypothetical protein